MKSLRAALLFVCLLVAVGQVQAQPLSETHGVVATVIQVLPDCSSAGFNSFCNQTMCNYHPSPASGCLNLIPGCQGCFRGDFLIGGGGGEKFDPTTQAAGIFQPFTWKGQTYERFIITNPGALGKHLKRGDVLRRIDGQRVTPETLEETFTRRPQSIEFYTPGQGVRRSATLRKAA